MNKNEENPWITKSTEMAYESPWISVSKSEVLNPAGNDAIYSVVSFKNLAIGILPLDENLNTWLVGQYRYPINAYSWEIPEGGGKFTDDPIDSAKRELREETGIVAKEFFELIRLHTSNSATDEYAIVYEARDLTFEEAEPEESEELQVKKLSLKEAFRMVDNGEITDAISVAAIYKAWIKYGLLK